LYDRIELAVETLPSMEIGGGEVVDLVYPLCRPVLVEAFEPDLMVLRGGSRVFPV
jgi:hypothetical protein